jgi:competence protein ComGC
VEIIQNKISDVFLCNREGTEEKLNKLDEEGYIVYKQDAGRKEIQIKKTKDKWELLSKYYGRI